MRLIDADALRRKRPFTIRGGDLSEYTEGYTDCAIEADNAVKDAPAVDAVPVVRCKDCDKQHGCKNAQFLGLDGFCSYGERRDDNG